MMENRILKHKKCSVCEKHFLGDQESLYVNQRFLTLRQKINKPDEKIFGLFEKRFKITKKIINEKKKIGMVIYDKKREKELINKESKKFRLNKEFIDNVYKLIFKESRKQ